MEPIFIKLGVCVLITSSSKGNSLLLKQTILPSTRTQTCSLPSLSPFPHLLHKSVKNYSQVPSHSPFSSPLYATPHAQLSHDFQMWIIPFRNQAPLFPPLLKLTLSWGKKETTIGIFRKELCLNGTILLNLVNLVNINMTLTDWFPQHYVPSSRRRHSGDSAVRGFNCSNLVITSGTRWKDR